MKNIRKLKNSTLAGALLLATSPAWANNKTGGLQPPQTADEEETTQPSTSQEAKPAPRRSAMGGKSEINISSIKVEKADKNKLRNCAVPTVNLTQPRPHRILSMTFSPRRRQQVTLQFAMAEIPTPKEAQVLLLLYSRCLANKPDIKTPMSKNKLALDRNDLEILGTYNVPAIKAVEQPNRPGVKASSPSTQMTIEVALETNKLAQQVKAGNDTFYFQAGLLKKTDYDKKNYGTMILSPLEALHFTPKTCPSQQKFSDRINAENSSCKDLPTKTN